MIHRTTPGFRRELASLPGSIQKRAEKQFALLKAAPHHPSLQFKAVGARHGAEIWSARVTLNYRALAIWREDGYLWFWIGDHSKYDLLIGNR